MKQYTVRIKDLDQDTTHVVHEYAKDQREANLQAYEELKKLLKTDNLVII